MYHHTHSHPSQTERPIVRTRRDRLSAAILLAGALALTACARPELADRHQRMAAPTMAPVTGHPPIPGENLPDPAKSELEGAALGRMQSGSIFSHL